MNLCWVSLRDVAIGGEPVHEPFAVLVDGPLVAVFSSQGGSAFGGEKGRMERLELFQGFNRGTRKTYGDAFVVRLHKNHQGCPKLIKFQFFISRSHYAFNDSANQSKKQTAAGSKVGFCFVSKVLSAYCKTALASREVQGR